MKKSHFLTLFAGVLLFCALGCIDLLGAWAHSPFDRFGWAALGLWVLPLATVWKRTPALTRAQEGLLAAGLGVSLVGLLGSLNVLQHIGLALALAGTVPWQWPHVFWLLAALSWMPVFGWAAGPYAGIDGTAVLRVLVALSGAIGAWLAHSNTKALKVGGLAG